MNEWVVVLRFVMPEERAEWFREESARVASLLAGFAGCGGVSVARAADDPTQWTLIARWESVGHYRRALGSYDVKVEAVPLLSLALDEPTAYEVLFAADDSGERAASGDLAGDADTVDRSR